MLEFDNKKLNLLCGLIFILFTSLFIIILDKIKLIQNDLKENTYTVAVDDVSNIKINQPVSVGGYDIGYVHNIELINNSPLLTIKIDKNIVFSQDTKMYISDESLFSSKKIINLVNGLDENMLADNGYIYSSSLGIDLNKLINLVEDYLQQNLR